MFRLNRRNTDNAASDLRVERPIIMNAKPSIPEMTRPLAPGSIFPLILPTTATSKKITPAVTNTVAKGAVNIPLDDLIHIYFLGLT